MRPDDGAQFFRVYLLRKSEAVRGQEEESGRLYPWAVKPEVVKVQEQEWLELQ